MKKNESESQSFCPLKLDKSLSALPQSLLSTKKTASSASELSNEQSKKYDCSIPAISADRQQPTKHAEIIGVSEKGIPIGESSPHAKYTDREIDEVFRLRDEEGLSYGEIGRIMDMPRQTAWAIHAGIRRGHVVARFKKVWRK